MWSVGWLVGVVNVNKMLQIKSNLRYTIDHGVLPASTYSVLLFGKLLVWFGLKVHEAAFKLEHEEDYLVQGDLLHQFNI